MTYHTWTIEIEGVIRHYRGSLRAIIRKANRIRNYDALPSITVRRVLDTSTPQQVLFGPRRKVCTLA